jgi:hypothetical protein
VKRRTRQLEIRTRQLENRTRQLEIDAVRRAAEREREPCERALLLDAVLMLVMLGEWMNSNDT